jgi:hypothetical protein
MTPEAWAGLMQEMRAGPIATMQEAREYLERTWGIGYQNGKELGWLFKKHRIKWKTGRRRHRKANAEQQAAFKKTLGAGFSRRSGSWPSTRAALNANWYDHLATAALVSAGGTAALDRAGRG